MYVLEFTVLLSRSPAAMNAFAPSLPTDIELPDWLATCLRNPKPENGDDLVCRAFQFAYDLHQGQRRASGEPYIAHPVAVASILRDLGGGPALLAAGFLHDVIEDTAVTAEELEANFGAEVRRLVEGVTKLSKFNFSSKTERQAESFRRMFLAMAQDIRVIVVKLADRLHNMRTLEYLPEDRRRAIAQETRDVFAPLANRLGIWRIKWELEDLAFKYLEPEAYRRIQELVAEKRANREAQLQQAIQILYDRLSGMGFGYLEISGRPKHLYSIYQKMMRQQKEFHEIYDVAGIRILVATKDECYRALAVVHDCFLSVPGRFKDYISLPKPNQYQSLHTVVIGLGGRPLRCKFAHWRCTMSLSMGLLLTGSIKKQAIPCRNSGVLAIKNSLGYGNCWIGKMTSRMPKNISIAFAMISLIRRSTSLRPKGMSLPCNRGRRPSTLPTIFTPMSGITVLGHG